MLTPETSAIQVEQGALHSFINQTKQLIGRLGLTASLVLAASASLEASSFVINPDVAEAETSEYPWPNAPCQFGSAGGSSCTNPNNNSDKYDWYWDENGDNKYSGYSENISPYGYYYRNCTDYAAWRVSKEFGVNVSGWGNAELWDNKARDAGYSVDVGSPEPGDIGVMDSRHVAFVESVNTDGSVNGAQFNGSGTGQFSNFSNRRFDHYIDINGEGKSWNNASTTNALPPPPPPNEVTAVSSQITPYDNVQHVYWATKDGKVRETWFGPPGTVHTNPITDFPEGTNVTELSSQYSPHDMLQHIYVGTDQGGIHEIYFGPNSGGYHVQPLVDFDGSVTAMSSFHEGGMQHVYVATSDKVLREVYFNPQIGVHYWPAAQSATTIDAITNQFTPNDGVQHVYWGNDGGQVHETWFRPGTVHTHQMAQLAEQVSAITSQITPDGTHHIYTGTDRGAITETWFRPAQTPYQGQTLARLGETVINSLSSQFTSADNVQHVFSATNNGSLNETWFNGREINGWPMPLDPRPASVTAISSQYTPADGVQHIYWGGNDGHVRETWFNGREVHTWQLPD